jgi:hypothetical protein
MVFLSGTKSLVGASGFRLAQSFVSQLFELVPNQKKQLFTAQNYAKSLVLDGSQWKVLRPLISVFLDSMCFVYQQRRLKIADKHAASKYGIHQDDNRDRECVHR